MSERDNLEIAKAAMEKVEIQTGPFDSVTTSFYVAMFYSFVDIAESLREIKVLFEQEASED